MKPTPAELKAAGLSIEETAKLTTSQLRLALQNQRQFLRDDLAQEIPGPYSSAVMDKLRACELLLRRLTDAARTREQSDDDRDQ